MAVHISRVLEKIVTLPLMPPQFDVLSPEVRRLAAQEMETVGKGVARDLSLCESPIEQMMLFALWDVQRFCSRIMRRDGIVGSTVVTQQAVVGTGDEQYRVDFLLEVRLPGKTAALVIECDGHAFHEKTKDQAARDKSRDRALTALGYTVLHFTGSEIWKDGQAQLEGDAPQAFFEIRRVLAERTGLAL